MFYQQNTTKINGGKITLYKRSDLAKSSWHYRIRFEQRDIRRSTKTTDLNEAKDIANDHFHECRVKLKEGLPIFDYLMKDVANEFLKGFDQKNITPQKRKQRKAFYKGMLKYWVELYGDKPINRISQKNIIEYLPWRLSYWTEGPGTHKKRPPQAKDIPSDTTLGFEFTSLKAVFNYALERGYIAHKQMPTIRYDEGERGTRPAFTLEEYRKIAGVARDRVRNAKGKPYYWKRWMTWHYFHIMVLTGIRVNEARNLKWKDIERITDKNGRDNIRLHVLETKRKKKPVVRRCIPFSLARFWFTRLRMRDWATNDDDLVFCKKNCQPYRDFSRGFNSLLKAAGLKQDRHGNPFTIYSCRHSHFTFQLFHGRGASLLEIAKNGGTSVKQLEDTYIKLDSTGSAHKLSGLDDGPRPDRRLFQSDKPPAEIIPYPDNRESA